MPQYIVQDGDTIFGIANKFGVNQDIIMRDNNTSGNIRPGQALNVYSEGAEIPQAAVTEEMLMESPSMPRSTYNAELLGNEPMELRSHGQNKQTIGAGLDFSSEGSAKINVDLARRAGIPEETIQSLLKGGQDVNITKSQATEANKLRYAKAFNDAKAIPGFDTADTKDQEFLADLVYNGAIKKSGYAPKDVTTKDLWGYLGKGDIAGAKKYLRTSNNKYAKDLYERSRRAGYQLISQDEYFEALKPIEKLFDNKDLNGILNYVNSSNDRAVIDTTKRLLGVEDLTTKEAKYKLNEFIMGIEMIPVIAPLVPSFTTPK